jgi:hypothetical protein
MIERKATGAAPTTLPFLDTLDGKGFEEYCTALLNSNPCLRDEGGGTPVEQKVVSAICQLGGRSQYGVDIRAKTNQGEEWVFQCKRVQSFGETQAEEVIRDAEAGFPKADHYVLVVTCGLEAKTLKVFDRPKWVRPWDAARLTTETQKLRPIENGINLVQRFFGPDWVKRLFVWGDQPLLKWDKLPSNDLVYHQSQFIGPSDTLEQLLAFARDGAGRALILTAPGGQGKSRLLLELAKCVEGKPESPIRVRFFNLGRSGFLEDQADFLSREKNLLLIVDDAHRLGTTLEDVARIAAQNKSVRLLVATRPHALEAVTSQVFKGYEERLVDQPLRLRALSAEDMVKLAEEVLGSQHSLEAPRLAGLADRCPLLVVIGGLLIKSGSFAGAMTDHQTFRERVFKGFKEDFLSRQPENARERVGRLIQILSFISPASEGEGLYKMAADIIGCSPVQVAEDLDSLKVAGLALKNREGIRLYPDLFADAVLLDACLNRSFLSKTILNKIPLSEFPAVVRNVAQADWEVRSKGGVPHSIFDPIWEDFVRRFREGDWPESLEQSIQRLSENRPAPAKSDRIAMLTEWATFAVYLPERTLELARLALEATPTPAATERETETQRAAHCAVCALLAPLVSWQPQYVGQALDLLWSLDFGAEAPGSSAVGNPITAIAEAASFGIHKPLNAAMPVVEWLDQKLIQPEAIERIRQTPWVLSALLKPLFERIIEHQWATGRTLHVQPIRVPVAETRPLRQRALAIAERFLLSNEKALAAAALPVVKEALSPIYGRFGLKPSQADYEAWRSDRMEALGLLERALKAHEASTVFLLQLRRTLRDRLNFKADDKTIKAKCKELLGSLPNSFELDMARALTSASHDFLSHDENQDAFYRKVAQEAITRFPDARQLCDLLRRELRELAEITSFFQAEAFLATVAALSSAWCISLLKELLTTEDASLDQFLWLVFRQAVASAPDDYRNALEYLSERGRAEQACALISFLGWKHTHGGGLEQFERETILRLATRPEDAVVWRLASTCGFHFRQEPAWALTVLSQLKPTGEPPVAALMEALDHLSVVRPDAAALELVARCFANIGERLLTDSFGAPHHVKNLARKFPKQLYVHLRNLLDQPSSEDLAGRPSSRAIESISLGRITDPDYLLSEVGEQWKKALVGGADAGVRLALVRMLVWSDPASAGERLRQLIEACRNSDELQGAAKLAAPQGTAFIFEYPNLVRILLMRGQALQVAAAVGETLYLSACGGGRSFTEGQLDPEYRYIAERGQDLANRYKDDPVLGAFYRGIVEFERVGLKRYQQMFRAEDEGSAWG